MDRTCDPCRVKASDDLAAIGASLEKRRFAGRGMALNGRKMHPDYTQLLYSNFVLCKIPLVNVRRHCDNPHEPIHSCVFSPLDGQVPPHRERSSEWAFCVLGRCFVMAFVPTVTTAGITGVPCRHHKASSSVRARMTQQMGLHGLHPKNTADRDRLPVLTPHAPSRKPKAIYRVPERGTNPPDSSGASGSSSNTPGRPTVVFLSASRPQVGGLTSDSSLAGQCTLVKARETVRLSAVVGRFHGVGVIRLNLTKGQLTGSVGMVTKARGEL